MILKAVEPLKDFKLYFSFLKCSCNIQVYMFVRQLIILEFGRELLARVAVIGIEAMVSMDLEKAGRAEDWGQSPYQQ